jgi:hypothetical protein
MNRERVQSYLRKNESKINAPCVYWVDIFLLLSLGKSHLVILGQGSENWSDMQGVPSSCFIYTLNIMLPWSYNHTRKPWELEVPSDGL